MLEVGMSQAQVRNCIDRQPRRTGALRMTPQRLEDLVLPHLGAAYNLARWLTRNDRDAEDIVQEAYLRALRSFDGFHGDTARPWLLAIVRNACHSWLGQQRQRDGHASFDEELHASGARTNADADFGADPETILARADDRRMINEALASLPAAFREVIVLRDLEELSYKEIAGIVDVPTGTVMSRLSRARSMLWDALRERTPGARP